MRKGNNKISEILTFVKNDKKTFGNFVNNLSQGSTTYGNLQNSKRKKSQKHTTTIFGVKN